MTETSTQILTLGENAVQQIAQILLQNTQKPHFRVQIKGGGCSGFEYVFGIDDTVREQDFCQYIENSENSFMLLVDAISFQYIEDANIDYVSDAKGARFVVSNPNAQLSCSCGSSFSTKSEI